MRQAFARWPAVVAVWAAWLAPAVVQSQDPALPPLPQSAPALDEPYVDATAGFAVRPPAGCDIIREQQMLARADVELVRFFHPALTWTLSVRHVRTTRPLDAQAIVESVKRELSEQFDHVEVAAGQPARVASREAVRCAATLIARGTSLLRQQAVVRIDPTAYFVLVFITPRNDSARATEVFDRVLESFEIVRSEQKEEQLRDALKRGADVLRAVASGNINLLEAGRGETFLRCILDGAESGFIQIRGEPAIIDTREGLAVHKWAWIFKPDGGVSHLEHHMFLATDLTHERWQSRLILLTPAPPDGQPGVLLDIDTGIRQDEKLMLTYTPQPNAPRLVEKDITITPPFAPAPWDVLLPRVIDLKQPGLYAFRLYDNTRKGLSLRAFRVVGPQTVRIGDRSVPAVKLEDSEGLVPPAHEMFVDPQGRLLRVLLQVPDSPLEMVYADRDVIERRYGQRVRETQALLRRLPIREPAPPGKDP